MPRTKKTLVSILGSSYFQPIANLVEQWNAFPHHRPNKVQSGFYESGYASSVVLLLVAMFESYVVRLRFVQGSKVPASARTALGVVFAIFPRLRHRKALIDVYVLRDWQDRAISQCGWAASKLALTAAGADGGIADA